MMFQRDQRSGWMVASKLRKQSLLVAVNALAGVSIFFFGYDQGMMGGVNVSPDYIRTMGFGHIDSLGNIVITNALLQGGIVAVYYLGTLLGCLLGGSIGDRYGRINAIGFGSLWAVLGAVLQCSAGDHAWMICARIVNGVGTGILNAVVPAWASEIVEYTSRGQFIAIEFTLNIFGVVVAYWLEYGIAAGDAHDSAFRWRFPIAFQIIPLLVLLAVCWLFPESPRWLVTVDRHEESLHILQRLRGTEGDDAGKAEAELADIRNVVALERKTSHQSTYYHMFFGIGSGKLHTGRRVQLCIWLQIMQSWTGISGVTMFGPTIFGIAGFGAQKAQWISGLNNVFYMFATLICVFTLDRIGRRWTLYWGSVVQGIAMFLGGGLIRGGLQATASGSGTAAGWGVGAASMVFLYTFVFGATWLTVPWLYPAEIFPLCIRAKGNAWGVVGWSIGCASLTLVLPYIVSAINEKLLYIFGACNIISIPIVWALYPESNQRTLEEMDMLFAADTPWAWDAERNFARLKEQNADMIHGGENHVLDVEGKRLSIVHAEKVDLTLN
ncbi:hypothetical protein LTR17_019856 [Elasticomyces elasticus]|nr:hypothetical protein LTR17_019856 [Elasticomyces elasticus]